MANRFPLTLNTVDKQIEELPNGTDLDLTGSSIVAVENITATGNVSVASLSVAGQNITASFSGNYNDLSNKPTIPTAVSELANDAGFLTSQTDSQQLGLVGNTLSISNGNSVSLTSILPTQLSELANDVGYISNLDSTSIGEFSDVDIDTVIPTNGQVLVWNSAAQEWQPGNVAAEGISELFDITGDDSTVRTVLPGSTIQIGGTGDISTASDVDGNIVITNNSTLDSITSRGATTSNTLTVGGLAAGTLSLDTLDVTGTGTVTLEAATDLTLDAGNAVIVNNSPFRVASFSTAERDNLSPANGDIIYNTSTNKFQGYFANSSWANLH